MAQNQRRTPMDLADYLQTPAVLTRGGRASLALPFLHLETLDEATVPWCRDWRAEIRMTDLDAGSSTPPVTVGAIDFVVVQLSDGEGLSAHRRSAGHARRAGRAIRRAVRWRPPGEGP
jgi:hypothetical protein